MWFLSESLFKGMLFLKEFCDRVWKQVILPWIQNDILELLKARNDKGFISWNIA